MFLTKYNFFILKMAISKALVRKWGMKGFERMKANRISPKSDEITSCLVSA